jgi:hypothetical protein
LSQIATLAQYIDWLCKLLKIKTFISQKFLDTPVFRLLRFRQKVLTDFEAPLELFSLEEEAAHVAGWPFRFGAELDCVLLIAFSGVRSLECILKSRTIARRFVGNSCPENSYHPTGVAEDRRITLPAPEAKQCSAMDVVEQFNRVSRSAATAASRS